MRVSSLSLTDFRNYDTAQLDFAPDGLIVFQGDNGQGKTNLLESISFASSSKSFRETSTETLVRAGADAAIVRCTAFNEERELLIEAEISKVGRNRLNVNRQPVRGSRSLDQTIAVTTFSPDDLDLVKAGPGFRRNYTDGLLANSDERQRSNQADVERILKQRNALLRQAGPRPQPEVEMTLDVWDERLAIAAEELGRSRSELASALQPDVQRIYQDISGSDTVRVGVSMITDWRTEDGGKGLLETLKATRQQDLARGTTTSGPHRDDLGLTIAGMPARSHASQGEQRSLAIALRLAGHDLVAKRRGSQPILLLDDVFSELDDKRTEFLLSSLPRTQCFLATAVDIPDAIEPAQRYGVSNGRLTP